ncbi:fungal-specific transcription factor domain-containing protein [Mrakia frigida]|uniref:Zn(II)2Cys6 transcription factor n=1 Tax=Mrakia frigida TaxID=29902 RepID=UPI003FCC172E
MESNSRESSPPSSSSNHPSPYPVYTPFHQQPPPPFTSYQPFYAQPSLPSGGGQPQLRQGGHPQDYAAQHLLRQQHQQNTFNNSQQQQQQQQQQYSNLSSISTHPANALLNLKRTHSDSSPSSSPYPNRKQPPSSSDLLAPPPLPSRAVASNPSTSSSSAKRMRPNYAPTPSNNSQSISGSGSEDDDDDSTDEIQPVQQQQQQQATGARGGASAAKGKGKAGVKVKTEEGAAGAGGKVKPKATRGSRACTVCRKLKMRCFSEEGPPCKRCKAGNHECVFEESNRGKKSSKKHEAMAQSLRKMEHTLNTVLRSIHNPTLASMSSGMVTRSPSPTAESTFPRQHTLPPIHTLGYHPSGAADAPGAQSQGSNSQASREVFEALMARGTAPAGSEGAGAGGGPSPRNPGDGGRSGSENPSLNNQRPDLPHPNSFPSSSTGYGQPSAPPPLTLRPSDQHSHSSHSHSHHSASPLPPHHRPQHLSPRLHSLPDNSLNPLGLLAEASLHNHKRAEARGMVTDRSGLLVRNLLNGSDVGSASASPGKGSAAGGGGGDASEGGGAGGGGGKGKGKATGEGKDGEGSGEKKEGVEDAEMDVGKGGGAEEDAMGVAGSGYFRPGPMTMLPLRRIIIEHSIRPEILDFLSINEVQELFNIYFDVINPQIPILDRAFHTPALVASRSPFLLTTICSIAAKFYTKRPELWGKLNTYVRKLAFDTPSMGYKSVEIVQAYLMLTSYGLPVERFEQDRTWLLLGMGIRVATDLNLQRKSAVSGKDTEEARARDREIVNRERTWLMCYVLDRSLSAQMGKPYSIREDFIIRNAGQWMEGNRYAMPTDRGLVAYTGLQQILSRSLDFVYSGVSTASGLQADIDYPLLLRSVEAQLNVWRHEWELQLRLSLESESDEVKQTLRYSAAIGRFYHAYALLMINSFGLQSALERSPIDLGHFFAKVSSAAMTVVAIARDELGPSGRLRHAPDSTFVMLSYAILSLLKLLRPELAMYHDSPARVISIATEAVHVLEEAAVSPLHTPALYASLLRSLLSSSNDSRPNSVPGTPAYRPPTRPASRTGFHPSSSDANAAAGPSSNNGAAPMSGGPESGGGMGGGSFPHLGSNNTSGEWPQNAFYAHPDGGSMGYGMEFALGMNGSGGGAAADGGSGGVDYAGPWGSADPSMNLETLWPQNASGLFDSMLMPGYANSMEMHGGVVTFGNGGSGAITPFYPSSPTFHPGGNAP